MNLEVEFVVRGESRAKLGVGCARQMYGVGGGGGVGGSVGVGVDVGVGVVCGGGGGGGGGVCCSVSGICVHPIDPLVPPALRPSRGCTERHRHTIRI